MAAYRYIPLQTETISWQASNGAELKVVVTLQREDTDYFGNGDWQPTRDGLSITTTPYIAGQEQARGTLRDITGRTDGVVAAIGNVGIKAPQYAEISAAYAALKAHPEMVARYARQAAALKVERECEAHYKAVESMMTLGGRSY